MPPMGVVAVVVCAFAFGVATGAAMVKDSTDTDLCHRMYGVATQEYALCNHERRWKK